MVKTTACLTADVAFAIMCSACAIRCCDVDRRKVDKIAAEITVQTHKNWSRLLKWRFDCGERPATIEGAWKLISALMAHSNRN